MVFNKKLMVAIGSKRVVSHYTATSLSSMGARDGTDAFKLILLA